MNQFAFFLKNTKAAWEGYAEGLESIAVEFEKGEDEMKKVKKRFNLQAAFEDLEKRQKIFNDNKNTIETMFSNIQHNYDVMTMTLPEDKKDFVKKEVKAVQVSTSIEFPMQFLPNICKSQLNDFHNNYNFARKNLKLLEGLKKRLRRLKTSVQLSMTLTRPSRPLTPG
jgi:hypothetical protein